MSEKYDGPERREHLVCAYHQAGQVRITTLEVKMDKLEQRQGTMAKFINVGIGLFLAGGLLVSILLAETSSIKTETAVDISRHEDTINDQQKDLNGKLYSLQSDMNKVQRNVDVLGTKVQALSESIEKDIKSIERNMTEMKQMLKIHDEGK